MSSPGVIRYLPLPTARWPVVALIIVSALLMLLGIYSAIVVHGAGHGLTGMNNHIVWGLPHIFAISLIVAASGAVNIATMGTVFALDVYKPWGRVSLVLAACLLLGGLLVLVLDLGRADRLVVAMTHYNFRSIFSWNIILYTGFVLMAIVYLWMLMEKRFNRYSRMVGSVMFAWRIILTSGTGCIFGFLVARNALDTAILAPLFIALSLVTGTAVFFLLQQMLQVNNQGTHQSNLQLWRSLRKSLLWFLLLLAYLSVVNHLTKLYSAEHQYTESYLLLGPMALWFWGGHIILGVVLPVLLLTVRVDDTNEVLRRRLNCACVASIGGGWCLLYSIIIGAQSTPLVLFPDKVVMASSFGDAGIEPYQGSAWEWALGLGGVGFACLLCIVVLRILPFLPQFNDAAVVK